jgi:hypothetical protein
MRNLEPSWDEWHAVGVELVVDVPSAPPKCVLARPPSQEGRRKSTPQIPADGPSTPAYFPMSRPLATIQASSYLPIKSLPDT